MRDFISAEYVIRLEDPRRPGVLRGYTLSGSSSIAAICSRSSRIRSCQ